MARRKFKAMTKAQANKMKRLTRERDRTMDAIYEGNGGNVPFWTFHALAGNQIKRDYELACNSIAIFERHLAAEGRGWVDGEGKFHAYSGNE